MMDAIFKEVVKALTYLFIAYIAFAAWSLAKSATANASKLKVLWQGLLWCLAIAAFTSLTLGTHTERTDEDPIYGLTERVQDFEPTMQDRAANFAYFMTLLYIPVAIGAFSEKRRPSIDRESN